MPRARAQQRVVRVARRILEHRSRASARRIASEPRPGADARRDAGRRRRPRDRRFPPDRERRSASAPVQPTRPRSPAAPAVPTGARRQSARPPSATPLAHASGRSRPPTAATRHSSGHPLAERATRIIARWRPIRATTDRHPRDRLVREAQLVQRAFRVAATEVGHQGHEALRPSRSGFRCAAGARQQVERPQCDIGHSGERGISAASAPLSRHSAKARPGGTYLLHRLLDLLLARAPATAGRGAAPSRPSRATSPARSRSRSARRSESRAAPAADPRACGPPDRPPRARRARSRSRCPSNGSRSSPRCRDVRDRVDREVAPREILVERRAELHLGVSAVGLHVAAEGRDLVHRVAAASSTPTVPNSMPDRNRAPEEPLHLVPAWPPSRGPSRGAGRRAARRGRRRPRTRSRSRPR